MFHAPDHAPPRRAAEWPFLPPAWHFLQRFSHLLDPERLTVKEVDRRLGYSSEFQLSRSFKRFEGVAPTAYVKSMTAKQRG